MRECDFIECDLFERAFEIKFEPFECELVRRLQHQERANRSRRPTKPAELFESKSFEKFARVALVVVALEEAFCRVGDKQNAESPKFDEQQPQPRRRRDAAAARGRRQPQVHVPTRRPTGAAGRLPVRQTKGESAFSYNYIYI